MHEKRRAPRTDNRAVLRPLLSVLITVVLLGSAGFLITEKYAGDIERIPDPFAALEESKRPDKPRDAAGRAGITFLVAGVDTRSGVPTTGAEAASDRRGRTDAVLLVRLTADRNSAYVVSIPRDAWVPVVGHGHTKINAAYAYGGATLFAATVEQLTHVRVDHVVVIDFAGFRELTDAVGGVTVTIRRPSYDRHRDRFWAAGKHRLDGEAALAYVRQRTGLPRGDLDRVQRHQAYLRALMTKLGATGTVANPVRLANVLDALTQTVSVDENLSNDDLRALAVSLGSLSPDQVQFATAPVDRQGRAGRQDVVHLDAARGRIFWDAFEDDMLPAYVQRVGADALGPIED